MAPEKRAFLIGPSYASFVKPPLEGVCNDLLIMKDMLMRNGFFSENIKVCDHNLLQFYCNCYRQGVLHLVYSHHYLFAKHSTLVSSHPRKGWGGGGVTPQWN